MTPMTRPSITNVVAVLVALWLGSQCSPGREEWRLRAELAEAAIAVMADEVQELHEANVALGDTIAAQVEAWSADSVARARQIAVERREAVQAGEETADRFSALRAAVDDSVRVMVDSLRASYQRQINALYAELNVMNEERDALYFQRAQLLTLVAGLQAEVALDHAIMDRQANVIAMWRDAASPNFLERLVQSVPQVGLGIAGGMIVGWMVTR